VMATMVRKKKPAHELRISTPKTRQLKWLDEAGVVVPGDIPLDDERVPLDFTRLSSDGIGELPSRCPLRPAQHVDHTGLVESDILRWKRELRIAKAKCRIHYRATHKNGVDALMEEDDEIAELFDRISEIEIKLTVLEAVVKTYEGIRNAASREISRQMGERAAID